MLEGVEEKGSGAMSSVVRLFVFENDSAVDVVNSEGSSSGMVSKRGSEIEGATSSSWGSAERIEEGNLGEFEGGGSCIVCSMERGFLERGEVTLFSRPALGLSLWSCPNPGRAIMESRGVFEGVLGGGLVSSGLAFAEGGGEAEGEVEEKEGEGGGTTDLDLCFDATRLDSSAMCFAWFWASMFAVRRISAVSKESEGWEK